MLLPWIRRACFPVLPAVLLALHASPAAFSAQDFSYQLACGTVQTGPVASAPALMLIGGNEASSAGEAAATDWFLQQAEGGNYLVLRSGGLGGQAGWICDTFPDRIASAAELSVDSRAAANNPEVTELIESADLVFLAGGDQSTYVDLWQNTLLAERLIEHMATSPVAGTSAGMMVLGESWYAPASSGVLSSELLDDPFGPFSETIGHGGFIGHPRLAATITDSHLDRAHGPNEEPRYGRLFGLLARLVEAHPDRERSHAIGLEEAVFVAVDASGQATVFGDGSAAAFFIQQHGDGPEQIEAGQPLVWQRGDQAVKAYRIVGTSGGQGAINLVNHFNASGGEWLDWSTSGGFEGFNFAGGECESCGGASPPARDGLHADRFEKR